MFHISTKNVEYNKKNRVEIKEKYIVVLLKFYDLALI